MARKYSSEKDLNERCQNCNHRRGVHSAIGTYRCLNPNSPCSCDGFIGPIKLSVRNMCPNREQIKHWAGQNNQSCDLCIRLFTWRTGGGISNSPNSELPDWWSKKYSRADECANCGHYFGNHRSDGTRCMILVGFGDCACPGFVSLLEATTTKNRKEDDMLFDVCVLISGDEGTYPHILVEPTTILAPNVDAAKLMAARMIPEDQMPEDVSGLKIKVRGW